MNKITNYLADTAGNENLENISNNPAILFTNKGSKNNKFVIFICLIISDMLQVIIYKLHQI